MIDGVVKFDVQLAFPPLSTGRWYSFLIGPNTKKYKTKNLSGETNLLGCDATQVGTILVSMIRNSKLPKVRMPNSRWQRDMLEYKSQVAGTAFDSLLMASKIDEKLFEKVWVFE